MNCLKEQVATKFGLQDESKMSFHTIRKDTGKKKMVTKALHLAQANKN